MRPSYDASFRVAGKVAAVYDTRLFCQKFPIRDVLIEAAAESDRYSNSVIVSLYHEDVDLGDKLKFGDYVVVRGKICGIYSSALNRHTTMLRAVTVEKKNPPAEL